MNAIHDIQRLCRLVEPQSRHIKSASELRELIRNCGSVPEALQDAVIDGICCPEVILVWNKVPQLGLECCPQLIVLPPMIYAGLVPSLHILPPPRLHAGFHPDQYATPASMHHEQNALRIKELKEIDRNERNAWEAQLPFQIPHNSAVLSGEHHFSLWLDFPDHWQESNRFFKTSFCIEVPVADSNGPRKLRIRGGAVNLHADLRGFDEVDIDADGAGNVQQTLTELVEEKSAVVRPVEHSLRLPCNRSLENRLPRVRCAVPKSELEKRDSGMLWFEHSNRRLYFFGEKTTLSFGRHTERVDVVTRFTPSSRGGDEQCPIRIENRQASTTISNEHCELQLNERGLLIRNIGDRKKRLPAETYVSGRRLRGFLAQEPIPQECRSFQLDLGGHEGELPRFEMRVEVVPTWDDPLSGGIPPVEDLAIICGDRRAGWRMADQNGIDAVVISHGRADRQAEATHVLLARQIFLDIQGRVVEDPDVSRRILGARLIYAGNSFFIQSVAAKLQLMVDGSTVRPYELVLLHPGMELQFHPGTSPPLTAEWHDPVFKTK